MLNFAPEQLLMLGAVIVTNTITVAGLWFKMQNRLERLEEKRVEDQRLIEKDCAELKRQIEAVWDWKDEHEKSANDMREAYNGKLAKLDGANMVVNEQFKQIMSSLNDIKQEFADIRERLFNLEKK